MTLNKRVLKIKAYLMFLYGIKNIFWLNVF